MSRAKEMNALALEFVAEVKRRIPVDAVVSLTIFQPGPKGFTTHATNASRSDAVEALRDVLSRLEKQAS